MPLSLEDIQRQIERQEGPSTFRFPTPNTLGGTFMGLGQLLEGASKAVHAYKNIPLNKKIQETAIANSKLESEAMQLNLDTSRQQAEVGAENIRKIRANNTIEGVTNAILTEGNPFQMFTDDQLKEAQIPVSLGPALLDDAGNVISQQKKILTIKDVYGDQINKISPRYQTAFQSFLNKPAAPSVRQDVDAAIKWATQQEAYDFRDYQSPEATKNPANKLLGYLGEIRRWQNELPKLYPNDTDGRQRIANAVDSLMTPLRFTMKAMGFSPEQQNAIVGQLALPRDFVERPPQEQQGLFDSMVTTFKNVFRGNFTPAVTPVPNNATDGRKPDPPPTTATTPKGTVVAPPAKRWPGKNKNEDKRSYMNRMMGLYTDDNDVAKAIRQEYPE